jgi:hypothetical protein
VCVTAISAPTHGLHVEIQFTTSSQAWEGRGTVQTACRGPGASTAAGGVGRHCRTAMHTNVTCQSALRRTPSLKAHTLHHPQLLPAAAPPAAYRSLRKRARALSPSASPPSGRPGPAAAPDTQAPVSMCIQRGAACRQQQQWWCASVGTVLSCVPAAGEGHASHWRRLPVTSMKIPSFASRF